MKRVVFFSLFRFAAGGVASRPTGHELRTSASYGLSVLTALLYETNEKENMANYGNNSIGAAKKITHTALSRSAHATTHARCSGRSSA